MLFTTDNETGENTQIKPQLSEAFQNIADTTKADIFLIDPVEKQEDGSSQPASKEQLKILIYGDMLTKENAKVRILILIDQMVSPQATT